MIKLRGGEYVSLMKVETVINKLPMIENCCLCASSSSDHTVVLICPNPKEMAVSLNKNFYETKNINNSKIIVSISLFI